ncbi:Exo endo phos domain containing protein [Trichuris trichiura]|uniref:Exo endo phos domain containing protein n=1 Tax=Trichuris trichiura TaxID=36087 RepID=A0A077ZIL2_TRITR|nr:Exo endo phos domain containing protein [Trichuris trichiura]
MTEQYSASKSETCHCNLPELKAPKVSGGLPSEGFEGILPFYWKTQIITYNVHRVLTPPSNFHPRMFYPDDSVHLDFDMIVVGLQEVGYIPSCYIANSLLQKKSWPDVFERFYASRGFGRLTFNLSGRLQMVGMILIVFIRRPVLQYVRKVEVKYVKTGFNGYLGHKGAICAKIFVGDGVNVVLVNSHLNPDPNNADYRIWEYNLITEKCRLSDAKLPGDYDYVLWFGDMNFRVHRVASDEAMNLIEEKHFSKLLDYDQLTILRRAKLAFHEYVEDSINFNPTYKYLPGTSQFDLSRLPSYCDRVLYRKAVDSRQKPGFPLEIFSFQYGPFMNVLCSDHKPVSNTLMITSYLLESSSLPIVFESPSCSKGTCWLVGRSNVCRYIQNANYVPGLWDWIGVYQMTFANDRDVITYGYMLTSWEEAITERGIVQNILFKQRYIPPAGTYLLGCFSRRNRCLVAISEPFEVIDPNQIAKSCYTLAPDQLPESMQTSMSLSENHQREGSRERSKKDEKEKKKEE